MHRPLTLSRRRVRDERGTVAIMVALAMTGLMVVSAMVLDFGLVRIDRQIDRAAADEATLAGLHGLNTGDGNPHPYAGVCEAVRYLRVNNPRFSGVSESTGWSNGLGTATADGCSTTSLRNVACKPTDKSTWAKWSWTGTSNGVTLEVRIESGYDLATESIDWAEEDLPPSSSDTGDPTYAGCDQLAVTILQSREPGLGSIATDDDLYTGLRSVGRIKAAPGDSAPAMLLLKRTGCPVLTTGSNAGSSWIRVYGAVSTDGLNRTQPGTVHADSDGVGCNGSNNSWVYGGLASNGIVAYAAPQASNPALADASKPGVISSYAVNLGTTGAPVRDNLNYVYGAAGISEVAPGTKSDVTGRSLVTRRLVDERYFTGVKGAIGAANTVFTSAASGAPAGWTTFGASVDQCKPTQAQINALSLTSTSKLFINCTTNAGFAGPGSGVTNNISIPAGTVYFKGVVAPSASLSLPNAHHVYVENSIDKADALAISNNTAFQVNNAAGNLSGTNCSTGQNASKSILFVKTGQFKQTGGTLRMCRTTAILMGGKTDGCVPATAGAAPTTTPCTGAASTSGTSQYAQTGGDIDWTAPDTINATQDSSGNTLATATAAWQRTDGPEDLALWSESYGSSSNPSYSMSGGGIFNVRGVFMMPNADPLKLSGSATLDLRNAQFISTALQLSSNNTTVKMSVDPNSAVTLPDQDLVGLVR